MRIAIDTGGTFTDCVYFQDGRLQVLKIFSTPSDPGQAVLEASGASRLRAKCWFATGLRSVRMP